MSHGDTGWTDESEVTVEERTKERKKRRSEIMVKEKSNGPGLFLPAKDHVPLTRI